MKGKLKQKWASIALASITDTIARRQIQEQYEVGIEPEYHIVRLPKELIIEAIVGDNQRCDHKEHNMFIYGAQVQEY